MTLEELLASLPNVGVNCEEVTLLGGPDDGETVWILERTENPLMTYTVDGIGGRHVYSRRPDGGLVYLLFEASDGSLHSQRHPSWGKPDGDSNTN